MVRESSTTSYEVYFLERRGCGLCACFQEHERYLALKSAKEGEEQGRATKIICEICYPSRNESEEIVAYLSRNLREVATATRGTFHPSAGLGPFPVCPSSFFCASRNGPDNDEKGNEATVSPGGKQAARNRKEEENVDVTMRLLASLATGLVSLLLSQPF